MDTNNDEEKKAESPPKKKREYRHSRERIAARRQLTPAQKAQAVALWRSGEVTLDDLSKKFGKRADTFSKMFSEMGVKKGEASKEHQERVQAEIEAKILSDSAQMASRVARVKDEHFKMADALGKLVWQEIVKAKQAGTPIDKLRGTIDTLRLASIALSNVRGELYKILQIDKLDERKDDDELPELTIRELTEDEVAQIQNQEPEEEDSLDIDDMIVEGSSDEVSQA